MKRNFLVFSVILAGFLIGVTSVRAELVGGKVVNIDAAANTLTVSQTNLETETQENITIKVVGETDLLGVGSFSKIKIGDEIWAEADEDQATKNWVASSIQRISDQSLKTEETTPAS